MSQQKDLLREIAAASNSGASDWLTEDFRLHEPIMAIYRFEEGSIDGDWGTSIRALWA